MIQIAPEAALELLDACAFYDAQGSGLGAVFRVVWQRTAEAAEAAPLAFPVHPFVRVEGVRRALLLGPPRFPYALAYLVHPQILRSAQPDVQPAPASVDRGSGR